MWIGISWHNGFERMISQDMMIVISQIKIDEMFIDQRINTMIIGEKMIVRMSTRGIVVTIMTLTIHQGMIEMIDALTKVIDIMMIGDPMT